MIISKRTWIVAAVSFGLIAFGLTMMTLGFTEGDPLRANIPGTIVTTIITLMAPWLASLFPKGEPLRRQMMFLAFGIVSYQIGNMIWTYYDVFLGGGPYPGIPDLFFYFGMYGCLGAGVWLALIAYRRVYRSAVPFVIAFAVSLLPLVLLWEGALSIIASDPTLGAAERALSLAYPLSDVFVLIFPSTALIVILITMGRATFARPWWPIAAAFWVLAVGDGVYSVAEWSGSYTTGTYLDTVWWFAMAFISIGISLMADVHLPSKRA